MPTRMPPDSAPDSAFTRMEVQIPMRDSVHLHTLIFVPKHASGPLPFILTRTPYGIDGSEAALTGPYAELAQDGYVFVFQDIRGRFGSGGDFVMLRPMRDRRDPTAVDESTDTYDTIDWLLAHVPNNNGRVGMLGVSYPGWLTVMAMLDPHPALKAVSPQASPADMFLGDDFHHNGAFRLSYGFEYAATMERSKTFSLFQFDQPDTYAWYLALGSLAHAQARLGDHVPTWKNFVAHPSYDAFWQRQAIVPHLDRVTVPTLTVSGWWDQEDFYGAITIYRALERFDTAHRNYLVVGPWNHGGWDAPTGDSIGGIAFGSPTALDFRKNIEAPWFAFWLKDKGTLTLPEATTFEGGSNRWRSFDSWPPRTHVTARKLYLEPQHGLSFDPPTSADGSAGFDEYVSDPANPVPYRKRPIPSTFTPHSGWPTWLYNDQRFLDGRPDVVSWETPPLTHDVTVAGDLAAHLFASTTGSDADWIVKLIDVYPEHDAQDSAMSGYELMVANDVFRGRFRRSFAHPAPITPNHVDEYTIDLHTQDYRFRAGHRIMVQVQSTWFPLIDRNPQTFVPNIFKAKDSDFHRATQRVFHSPRYPSYLQVPVLDDAVAERP